MFQTFWRRFCFWAIELIRCIRETKCTNPIADGFCFLFYLFSLPIVAGYNGVTVKEGMPRFQVAARDEDSQRVIAALKQLYRCGVWLGQNVVCWTIWILTRKTWPESVGRSGWSHDLMVIHMSVFLKTLLVCWSPRALHCTRFDSIWSNEQVPTCSQAWKHKKKSFSYHSSRIFGIECTERDQFSTNLCCCIVRIRQNSVGAACILHTKKMYLVKPTLMTQRYLTTVSHNLQW